MQNTDEKIISSQEVLSNLEDICIELKKRKHMLNLELSTADKKKTDIEHYIEFYQLSASQGYKVAKMLKDCLEERRNIKNELQIIDNALGMSIGYIANGKGHDLLVKKTDKQYQPRILKELFNQPPQKGEE